VHVFVGLLLVLPVLLKIAATGWRFARYYRGDAGYVRRGPPRLPLRVVAPLLVITSLSVLGTGIALVFTHSRSNVLLTLHKASFIAWAPAFGVHFIAYALRVPRLVVSASRLQRFAVVGVLALSAVLTVAGIGFGHPAFDGDADLF
jgi:hypothetical protein